MTRVAVVLTCLSSVAPLARASEAPPIVSCDANPAAAVPDFKSFAVTEDPTLLGQVAAECLKPLSDLDAALDKIYAVDKAKKLDTAKAAFAVGSKLSDLRDAVIAIGGGAELYLAKCVGLAALETVSPSARLLVESAVKTKTKFDDEYKKLQDKRARGTPPSNAEIFALGEIANQLVPGTKLVTAAKSIVQGIAAGIERPERFFRSLEGEVGVTLSRAADAIGRVTATCQVAAAENELKVGTERGQEGLTAARLASARARKEQRKTEELLDRQCGNAWRRDALVVLDCKTPLFEQYARYTELLQEAEQKREAFEKHLAQAGSLCQQLREQGAAVERRLAQYQTLASAVQADVASCSQDRAKRGLVQLANLAGSDCGAYLTGTSPEGLRVAALQKQLAQCASKAQAPAAGATWAGTYTSDSLRPTTLVLSGGGGGLSGTWTHGTKGQGYAEGTLSCAKVEGTRAECTWQGVWVDDSKEVTESGTSVLELGSSQLIGTGAPRQLVTLKWESVKTAVSIKSAPGWDWKIGGQWAPGAKSKVDLRREAP